MRYLPNFRGKKRLLHFLFKQKIESATQTQLKGRYGINYLVPNLKENIAFDIFANGVYEQETIDFICEFLPKDGVFFDLGSNIGAILLPVAKRLENVKIIAVEAAPWLFAILEKNVSTNGLASRISIYNKALFNEDDQTLSFYSPEDKFGKGSLSPVFTKKAVMVQTITLDTLCALNNINKIDVIKIDVEGFEDYVFRGGRQILSTDNAPVIIFEFLDWAENQANGLKAGDAQRTLLNFGYILYEPLKGQLKKISQVKESGAFILIASKHEMPD